MSHLQDVLMISLVLTNMLLLGSSSLRTCIRSVAIQGILLGVLTLSLHGYHFSLRLVFLATMSMILKGLVFPKMLTWTLREAEIRREVEPFIGFVTSLLSGVALLVISLWISHRIPLPTTSNLALPIAFFMIFVGLFVIVSRRQAISQVLGYLIMENGIYFFGVAFFLETSFWIELGILLDVFVGVFVMGIAIFHINREFDHIDTERLSTLKD